MASRERLRRLHDANDEMVASLDLEHRLRSAVKSARDLVPGDAAAVFLPNEEGDALVIRAHLGLSASYAARQRLPVDEVRAQVRAAGEHVILDMPSGSVGDHALIRAEGLAKLLSIPLFFQEKLTGVLVIYTKDPKRTFESDDIEVAHLLAASTAIGITNSRLYAEALAQQDLHRHLLDALGDGILIGWPNGRYEANPRAREILGVAEFDTLAQLLRSRMRRARAQGTELDMESLDRNLAAIERQVDRMNGLVNDLLSVSRAEKGSLSMERVSYDLALVLREVVQRYVDATLEEGRHTFTVEAPASVPAHGDQSRVEQLLMNLVGNAVKYSPTGGEVRIALTAHDRNAEITISDQGIGIPPEEISKLGHPFVRGAGRANSFAGMGVGLYVARIVAEAHAGSLALESDGDGKGTTVRVKLPL